MPSNWCWSFLANPPVASHWTLCSRSLVAIGAKPILAGGTSCSCAVNATAQRASSMLAMPMIASGFSVAANALGSPISPRWAIAGTARRVVSRNCALGSNGEGTAPCLSSPEPCTSGRTSVFWGCWPTTRPCESRGELRSKRQARSTSGSSVASMPKQVCNTWRMAASVRHFRLTSNLGRMLLPTLSENGTWPWLFPRKRKSRPVMSRAA
jgi:hypothetical protein